MRDTSFHDHIMNDVLTELEGITSKSMFGGWGLYQNGIIFGIIADGEVYFKVDELNKPEYEALDSRPFTYEKKNHPKTTMGYWLVPEEILENKERLYDLVLLSVEVSKRAKKKK